MRDRYWIVTEKIIGFLFRTLRDKNGHLSAERFINIKDGKNFMKEFSEKEGNSSS